MIGRSKILIFGILGIALLYGDVEHIYAADKKEVIVITDLYHPYQDPGDNLDLINAFALEEVNLKAILLDITDSFLKKVSDHPFLWQDPYGPRQAGFVPVAQLNHIFRKNVPCAMGPITAMTCEEDKMEEEIAGGMDAVHLLLKTLQKSRNKVEVVSFGSARILAVAFNRDSLLLKRKIGKIHLCASKAIEAGVPYRNDNDIWGGEWNVALDVYAFTRIIKSGLPIALYPCAGKNGVFECDSNSSFWKLDSMDFLRRMNPLLQCYIHFVLDKIPVDDRFLDRMNDGAPYSEGRAIPPVDFKIWESAVWLNVTERELVQTLTGDYLIKRKKDVLPTDYVLENSLLPCIVTLDDKKIVRFVYTDRQSNIEIYYRPDADLNQKALNSAIPRLMCSYR